MDAEDGRDCGGGGRWERKGRRAEGSLARRGVGDAAERSLEQAAHGGGRGSQDEEAPPLGLHHVALELLGGEPRPDRSDIRRGGGRDLIDLGLREVLPVGARVRGRHVQGNLADPLQILLAHGQRDLANLVAPRGLGKLTRPARREGRLRVDRVRRRGRHHRGGGEGEEEHRAAASVRGSEARCPTSTRIHAERELILRELSYWSGLCYSDDNCKMFETTEETQIMTRCD